MNCQKAQRRLLSLADPARVPTSVQAHLDECSACRDWQRRLLQVERHIPLLVVPPSSLGKARTLRKLRNRPVLWEDLRRGAAALPDFFRQGGRLRIASSIAAALVLFAIAWTLLPGVHMPANSDHGPLAADRLIGNLLDSQVALARAANPKDQVVPLANLAGDLHGEAQALGRLDDGRESLREVATWYGRVVDTEVKCAAKVPLGQRATLLAPLSQRLAKEAGEARTLARDTGGTSAEYLRKMAAAADAAKRQLDMLSNERLTLHVCPNPLLPTAAAFLAEGGKMARRLPLAATPLLAASALWAQDPSASRAVRRFQQNRDLIEALVNGSVGVAQEENTLKRAEMCTEVASRFATEIGKAVDSDTARAAQLSEHLRVLLQDGVAPNLKRVAANPPDGSLSKRKFEAFDRELEQVMAPLEKQAQDAASSEARGQLEKTLRSIQAGRGEIKGALDHWGQPEAR